MFTINNLLLFIVVLYIVYFKVLMHDHNNILILIRLDEVIDIQILFFIFGSFRYCSAAVKTFFTFFTIIFFCWRNKITSNVNDMLQPQYTRYFINFFI